MSITRADFDAICEADLVELVAGQVPEGLYLDYKRETYGPRDDHKRELLKDVSAFANANGGHIVIGLEETEGVASQLYGIKIADVDVEVSRLDQIIGLVSNLASGACRPFSVSIPRDSCSCTAKLAPTPSGLRAKLQ